MPSIGQLKVWQEARRESRRLTCREGPQAGVKPTAAAGGPTASTQRANTPPTEPPGYQQHKLLTVFFFPLIGFGSVLERKLVTEICIETFV